MILIEKIRQTQIIVLSLFILFVLSSGCSIESTKLESDSTKPENEKTTRALFLNAKRSNTYLITDSKGNAEDTYLYFLADGETLIASGRALSFISQGKVNLPAKVGAKSILIREVLGNKKIDTLIKGDGGVIKYELKL